MAVYAATVSRMDKAIGDLTNGLRERGQLKNTLILFMSDNGGNAEAGADGRDTGDPTQASSNWFCGESWAFLQNTPFRLYKHYNHEGGIASPLIVHWPSGIAAKNELRKQPAHLIDIMATCIDVAGTEPLRALDGIPLTPLEGRSLVPAFNNEPLDATACFGSMRVTQLCVTAIGNWFAMAAVEDGNCTIWPWTARSKGIWPVNTPHESRGWRLCGRNGRRVHKSNQAQAK